MTTPCDLDHAAAVTAARAILGDRFADDLAAGFAAAHPTYGPHALRFERKRMMAQSRILVKDD